MEILWITNVALPEASALLNQRPQRSGGWLVQTSKILSNTNGIDLSIAFPSKKVDKYKKLQGKNIKYFAFKNIKRRTCRDYTVIRDMIYDANPELVHIHGTELFHSLLIVEACKELKIKYVVSIQGLVSVIAKHMYANLPNNVIFGSTLRNLLNQDSVYWMKKSFQKRGYNELEAIKRTSHIIGRTTWDRAITNQINPEAKYHFCNETLREEFYKNEWSVNHCEKYSIFLSQGQYSIKGLHYMLEAMPLILKRFPEAKVYISGKDITKIDSLRDKLFMTYYGKHIKKMIKNLGLVENVFFTGPLDEENMCQRYLKSHVFVCPSSIENSPNSLGEAMILGIPSVASYVGGIPDMLKDKEEGFLYQHDAPYMLAHYVCEVFENEDLALRFSKNARDHALKTHDRDENTKILIRIYSNVLDEEGRAN